jgi:hydrogenase 3 maturation protease
MNVLMGIGNALRCDDGVGVYVARMFHMSGWRSLDCGTAPENFTGVVRREHPDLLLIVDAADMNIPPGEFRVIPFEKIQDVGIGTHQLPLTHLISYLGEDAGEIIFIGIQPLIVDDGEQISLSVKRGGDKLINLIENGLIGDIQIY